MNKNQAILYVNKFYDETLKWCHCGDPEDVMRLMRDVLAANEWNFSEEGRKADYSVWQSKVRELLGEIGSPLCLSYFYMLDVAGLTEHGGGLVNGGWLTDEGKELLEALRIVGDEEWSDNEVFADAQAKGGPIDAQ